MDEVDCGLQKALAARASSAEALLSNVWSEHP